MPYFFQLPAWQGVILLILAYLAVKLVITWVASASENNERSELGPDIY